MTFDFPRFNFLPHPVHESLVEPIKNKISPMLRKCLTLHMGTLDPSNKAQHNTPFYLTIIKMQHQYLPAFTA